MTLSNSSWDDNTDNYQSSILFYNSIEVMSLNFLVNVVEKIIHVFLYERHSLHFENKMHMGLKY